MSPAAPHDPDQENSLTMEAITNIPFYRIYIAKKRAFLHAQIAKLQPASEETPTPAGMPFYTAFSTGNIPAYGENASDAAQDATSATPDRDAAPSATSATDSATPATDGGVSNATEATPPAPTAAMPPSAAEPAPLSTTPDPTEVAVDVSVPTTPEEAVAQLEREWNAGKSAKAPLVVQDAYTKRKVEPERFANLMVSAAANGYLPVELERAVGDLVRLDTHFQDANLLYQGGDYPALFEIDMQDVDYGAGDREEDTDTEGEADRAANNGEEPF